MHLFLLCGDRDVHGKDVEDLRFHPYKAFHKRFNDLRQHLFGAQLLSSFLDNLAFAMVFLVYLRLFHSFIVGKPVILGIFSWLPVVFVSKLLGMRQPSREEEFLNQTRVSVSLQRENLLGPLHLRFYGSPKD